MFVVAPFDCLVEIAACKQKHLHGKINLRQTRQPNTLHHSRLFHYYRSAGTQINEQTPTHFKALRKSSFKTHHLLVSGIDPGDSDQFRDQILLTITGFESGSRAKIEDYGFAIAKALATRRDKLMNLQELRDIYIV